MAFTSKFGNLLRQTVGRNFKPELSAASPSIYQAIRIRCMSSSKLFVGGATPCFPLESLVLYSILHIRMSSKRKENIMSICSVFQGSHTIQMIKAWEKHLLIMGKSLKVCHTKPHYPRTQHFFLSRTMI